MSQVIHVDSPEETMEDPFTFTPMEEGYFPGLMQVCCQRKEPETPKEFAEALTELRKCAE